MMTMILGGNNSGKSAYAEACCAALPTPLVYIATMLPFGEAGRARVEKHQRQRASMHFLTIEEPYRMGDLKLPSGATVLLEDVSNLLANNLFERRKNAENVYADILALRAGCKELVLVSISGLEPTMNNAQTDAFIEELNWLNQTLINLSDCVVEMTDGTPVVVKGTPPCAC